jgi:hypothetical protein
MNPVLCFFCDYYGEVEKHDKGKFSKYRVVCPNEKCKSPIEMKWKSELDSAIEDWNTVNTLLEHGLIMKGMVDEHNDCD